MNLQQIIDAVRAEFTKADAAAESLRSALGFLEDVVATHEITLPTVDDITFGGHRAKATKPAPKKTTAPALAPPPEKVSKKKAPVADDSPRTVKGRMPTKGVQQSYCENLQARQAEVGRLKALGYTRVGPGQPIVPGAFDVRSSGDGDESVVVLWRERAEAAA